VAVNARAANVFPAGTPDASCRGMNARLAPPILALFGALSLAAGTAGAQDRDHPKPARGKIDGVEREARRASSGSGGSAVVVTDDDDGSLADQVVFGILHSIFIAPETPGQGYLAYPYAEPRNRDAFVMRRMATGRQFVTMAGTYFNDQDVGGSLQAGQFTLEGANGMALSSLEYTLYREPTQRDTDWLHLARVAIGVAPRLDRFGYMRVLFGARVIVIDDGSSAIGPELEVGVQAFPVRPWGVTASARGALVQWNSGLDWSWGGTSPFADLNGNLSYFLGRVELQAGWRYTRIGGADAFNGPTAGVRLWF